jgi:hypothetical protein
VHPAEGVRRAAGLDVALKHKHIVPILGRESTASQAAHAAADDDDVILALVAAQAVARAWVGRLLVCWLERHVVAEGHDLLARRVFCLGDVGVRLRHVDGGASSMRTPRRPCRCERVAESRRSQHCCEIG